MFLLGDVIRMKRRGVAIEEPVEEVLNYVDEHYMTREELLDLVNDLQDQINELKYR